MTSCEGDSAQVLDYSCSLLSNGSSWPPYAPSIAGCVKDEDVQQCEFGCLSGICNSCIDADNDGYHKISATCPESDDCNDMQAEIHPGTAENCNNSVDDDCDSLIDMNDGECVICLDIDKDGHNAINSSCPQGDDCNDNNPYTYPGAMESCHNNIDDDCDGRLDMNDPDCLSCSDSDHDGYYSMGKRCPQGDDCAGDDSGVNPGMDEICNNSKDDDCDSLIDMNDGDCIKCLDNDNDGYYAISSMCPQGTDCKDNDPFVYVGADENCGNLIDDDCDGLIDMDDNECIICDDSDDDEHFAISASCPQSDDCDDANENVYPSANELCNGIDDDCDGSTDEGCQCIDGRTRECGLDIGECSKGTETCTNGQWDAICQGSLGPSAETCDGLDNNCDGSIDETFTNLATSCSAGIGQCAASGVYVCSANGLSSECNAQAGNAGEEVCDNLDNDCDGIIDDNLAKNCGSLDCAGTQTCSGGEWSDCSSKSNDCGTCAACDEDGDCSVYDESQDNDCAPTNCASGCSIDSNPFTWDESSTIENQCSALFTCTQKDCNYQNACADNDENDGAGNGKCNALCDQKTDCACPADTCADSDNDGKIDDYINFESYSECGADCSCGECSSEVTLNDGANCGNCDTDSDCDDGKYCNGAETCISGFCESGAEINCSANNVAQIATCNYSPDSNPFSIDFYAGFESACSEETDSCTTEQVNIQHKCDMQCSQCVSNTDCDDSNKYSYDVCTEGCICEHRAIRCFSDLECKDSDSMSRDKCINPGTAESYCENKRPALDQEPREKFRVSRVRLNNNEIATVKAGDQVTVSLNFENIGRYNTHYATIRVTIPDLGISRKLGPFTGPQISKEMMKDVVVDIPKDAEAGEYTMRISLSDLNGVRRTKHRTFKIK